MRTSLLISSFYDVDLSTSKGKSGFSQPQPKRVDGKITDSISFLVAKTTELKRKIISGTINQRCRKSAFSVLFDTSLSTSA